MAMESRFSPRTGGELWTSTNEARSLLSESITDEQSPGQPQNQEVRKESPIEIHRACCCILNVRETSHGTVSSTGSVGSLEINSGQPGSFV
ncbi:hypothetical protein PM082_017049 [Marasmius tenuissimus]|nr:hypothetical protein PM082_017049 [Marasmius tenuissimus]